MPRVTNAVRVRRNRSARRVNVQRRRTRISRGMVSTRKHHFIRNVSGVANSPIAVNSNTGFGGTVYSMQLNFALEGVHVLIGGVASTTFAMPNYTEFSALYDQYRIDYVEASFLFSNNNSSVNSPGTTLPVFIIARDYDDSGNANYTDLQQYNNAQVWQVGEQQGRDGKKVVRVRPSVDTLVYNTALTSGYSRSKPMFIDTSSPAVPHYGLKLAFDPIFPAAVSTVVGYLSMNFKYHMTMNNTK